MISVKYKEMYDTFVNHYKNNHVNPWHEISEEELNQLYNNVVLNSDIDNDYSFNYLMNVIIKRLSGITDAHTQYDDIQDIPMNFKIFENEVLVNYPETLKGASLLSINDIDINKVINELDSVITYGTMGKKIYETEKALINKKIMFGIPLFRTSDSLKMNFKAVDGNVFTREFKKQEKYSNEEMFDEIKYRYGNPGTYKIENGVLIINHSSVQNRFKEKIENMMNELNKLDLSDINTIIVDIRGNTGGNSAYNKQLMEFIKKSDKRILCLTDYRIFSAGRYALIDLMNLGATTIGTEISTPLNCYGNSKWLEFNNHYFVSSSCFFAPNFNWSASTKEEFLEATEEIITPVFFKPDIYIEPTKEDYINGIDTVLNYALSISKEKQL